MVSIIIPAYNAGRFIAETIDSVLKQTYKDWELIIVNDGSTDNTQKIVEEYRSNNPTVHIINQENKGVSNARNAGIKKASGEFIAFLDADDVWMEDNLKEKINFLVNNHSVDFVFSDRNFCDEKMQNTSPAPIGYDENIFENCLLWNGESVPGPCSNLVIKKNCFQQDLLFHPALSNIADKHFVVQLASRYKGKRIPKVLWSYRIVSGSMSKNIGLHETDTLKAYSLYKKEGFFKSRSFQQKCFSNMYLIVGASWWKDGGNKMKGAYFVFRALLAAPIHTLKKIFAKLFKFKS